MTSSYFEGLHKESQTRYLSKLRILENDLPDPMDEYVRLNVFADNVSVWPNIEFGDIYSYLIDTTAYFSKETLKAYKSLEGYNYYSSGKIKEILVYKVSKLDVCMLWASVVASQREKVNHEAWITTKMDGQILNAHCSCMAGLGEACSHTAALMFAVDAAQQYVKSNPSCTSLACSWKKIRRTVNPKPVDEILFKKPKREQPLCYELEENGPQQKSLTSYANPVGDPRKLLKSIKDTGFQSAVFTIVSDSETDTASENGDTEDLPNENTGLPKTLQEIFIDDSNMTKEQFKVNCDHLVNKISITESQSNCLEKLTRLQSESDLWKKYRIGLVTSSFFGRVLSCKSGHDSLLSDIFLYNTFSSKQTDYGSTSEVTAKDDFIRLMASIHSGVEYNRCGLVINQKYPYLGTSPDGILSCSCCEGSSLIEIKCPYQYRTEKLEVAVKDKNFFLDSNYNLKKNHKHFAQVQGQMAICGKQKCYFVVWTKCDIVFEIVSFDQEWWDKNLETLKTFFTQHVLLELCTKSLKKRIDATNTTCPCKGLKKGVNLACSICQKSYHLSCVGLKRKLSNWTCSECCE